MWTNERVRSDAAATVAMGGFAGRDGAEAWKSEPKRPSRTRRTPRLPGSTPRFRVLHEIFEAQADARPETVAVLFGQEATTYFDLENYANRLARHLRTLKVRPGALVAILLPRSVDAYASQLGVLKAGGAYVPIDPDYPADRVACILNDSGASALVTTAELAEGHSSFSGAVVRVDADNMAIAAHSSARLPRKQAGVGPRDLCYVIYTSG
ncbi:MAG TPA: AMP-binding protein, partial [Candidatus Eisenbacteria bacterium]|nr:AMP-binding protein [Candidatus Eisenbacteria bacterium]